MNYENSTSGRQEAITPKIDIEPGLNDFIPEDFKKDPIKYFEEKGVNIKSGDIKQDESGRVREDPTAVKDLPVWRNQDGLELHTVGKRVNTAKGNVGESGDPFYEYKVMEVIQELGLPCPRPVSKVEQGGNHLIVMERVPGFRWADKDTLNLDQKGYSSDDIKSLYDQAEVMLRDLHSRFEEAGITRGWKLKDMIFNIDIENKKIISIVPVDWERTKLDQDKLDRARKLKADKIRLGAENFSNWVRPDISGEMGEIQRVAQEFLGQELTKSNIANVADVLKNGEVVELSDQEWDRLENTDSFHSIRPGEIEDAEKIVDGLNQALDEETKRNFRKTLTGFLNGSLMAMPMILKKPSGEIHLVSGNTRLMICRALKIRPKVVIGKILK